jgi:hypothetical protein
MKLPFSDKMKIGMCIFGVLFKDSIGMKNHGDYSYVYEMRDREILHLYKLLRRTCEFPSLLALSKKISEMPASRFYMSEERALVVLKDYSRIGACKGVSRYKLRLYNAFLEEYRRHRGESISQRIRRTLYRPAPCLGISPQRILSILTKMGAK